MGIWSFWLFLGVGFLVAELFTMSTTCLYVGIGALIAMLSAFLGGEWMTTILTFVFSTAFLYLLTYRWRHRIIEFLNKDSQHGATGMEALIGRSGTVFAASDSMRMKIDGDTWQVKPLHNDAVLSPGEEVCVVGYDSIILKVEKSKNKNV
ncbi:MAG: NfeD family protein [Muribaculaceae bacterium]|nr:NfeD family protein [Muribaculaceae bacterium]